MKKAPSSLVLVVGPALLVRDASKVYLTVRSPSRLVPLAPSCAPVKAPVADTVGESTKRDPVMFCNRSSLNWPRRNVSTEAIFSAVYDL